MTFIQMRCFLSLSKTRKMSVTAAQMGLSLSTLSKYIDRMESELYVKLFIRNLRQMELTREGRLIYPSIEYMVKQYDDQYAEIYKYSSSYESVIKVVTTLHQVQVVRQLISFMRAEPKIKLEIKETSANNIFSMIDSGKADIGIIYEQLGDKKYPLTYPLRYDKLVAVVSEGHHLAKCKKVFVNDLRDEIFYLYKSDHLMYQYLIQICIAAGFAPREEHSDLRMSTILINVAAGNGISLMPENTVETLSVTGVVSVSLDEDPRLTLCAICASEYLSSPIAKLIHFMVKETDDIDRQ